MYRDIDNGMCVVLRDNGHVLLHISKLCEMESRGVTCPPLFVYCRCTLGHGDLPAGPHLKNVSVTETWCTTPAHWCAMTSPDLSRSRSGEHSCRCLFGGICCDPDAWEDYLAEPLWSDGCISPWKHDWVTCILPFPREDGGTWLACTQCWNFLINNRPRGTTRWGHELQQSLTLAETHDVMQLEKQLLFSVKINELDSL